MEDPTLQQRQRRDDQDLWSDDDGDEEGPTTSTTAAAAMDSTVVDVIAASPTDHRRSRQEIAEQAAARAEVAVLEGTAASSLGTTGRGGGTQRNVAADQALLGAVNNDAVDAHNDVLDESGELVRQAFVEFLQN
jgi:hypothetical protein